MNKKNDFRVSFFRPTNDHAKANRNMVLILLTIWAVAVFGFQFLLRVMEKPVPEPALTEYYQVNEAVLSGQASLEQKQVFIQSLTSVLGKQYLRDLGLNKQNATYYPMLKNTLGWVIYDIIPAENKTGFKSAVDAYNHSKKELNTLLTNQKTPGRMLKQLAFERRMGELEQVIIVKKKALIVEMAPYIDQIIVDPVMGDVRKTVVYSQTTCEYQDQLPQEYITTIDKAMDFYLVHNRSAITDYTFFGFPFHYFYTAILLLALFIAICWVYAFNTERINKKFGIED
ncbi:MAG: sodium/substrate symporter small subunit [Marinifilaceae bacterium]